MVEKRKMGFGRTESPVMWIEQQGILTAYSTVVVRVTLVVLEEPRGGAPVD